MARRRRRGRSPRCSRAEQAGQAGCAKVRDRADVETDQKIRFTSAILPKWALRTKSLDALLPILYLNWPRRRRRIRAMREIGWRGQSGGVVSRHFDDLDAVLKSDSLDDFRQLIFALQSSPGFCGRGDELEHHQLGGFCRQGSLRPHGSMSHLSEHTFDRV
jgi:hypothetical protein